MPNKCIIENTSLYTIQDFNIPPLEAEGMLEDAFLSEFKHFINWDIITAVYVLSDEIIIKYLQYINKEILCKHQCLTRSFVMEHLDVLDLNLIARYQFHIGADIIYNIRKMKR